MELVSWSYPVRNEVDAEFSYVQLQYGSFFVILVSVKTSGH